MHLRSPAGTIFQVFIPVALVIAGLVLSKTLGQAGEDNTAPVPLLISSAYYANLTNLTSQGGRLGQIPNLLLQDTASTSIYKKPVTVIIKLYTFFLVLLFS